MEHLSTSPRAAWRQLFAKTLLAATTFLCAAGASAAVTMEGIEFSSLPGDKTEIRMKFDAPPPVPTGYTIESPARIALDLMDTKSGLDTKYHALGNGNAREVVVVEAKDRTRVIVNLTQLVAYDTRVEGNTLYVLVGSGGAEASEAMPTPNRTAAGGDVERRASAPVGASSIKNVDFRRGAEGEGRVVITLSNPKVPVDVTNESGKVKVVIRNTDLPPEMRRRLDVTDFATPVSVVDAVQSGPDVVFTITATGDWDYLAYQADEALAINVNPITPEKVAQREDIFKYKGEKLSLNFQDIEVRSVLQLIADFTDLNLVASDTVSGRITLRLKNVPWDQALELILKTKGLDKRQTGNVMLVAPAAEIAAREKLELENQKQISELAPLQTDFVEVRYAKAADLYKLFQSKGKETKSMLSERGSVIVDERTNAIIITDTSDRLEAFRRVIAQLDVPVRQVLIESRIVTASTNYSQELGIRWGGGGFNTSNGTAYKTGGSLTTLGELQNIITSGSGSLTSPDDLAVDLGVTAPNATTFAVGIAGANYLVDLELSALETDGHAEVVARPKVITADKQKALIQSGTEIPYQEASSSGATSTSFKEAVLSLEVTPQITPDDRIIMNLKVNQDTVGQIFNGVPSIDTNQVTTQVLVDNGQTVVLGGIFKDQKTNSITKTPFLGDIPFLGRLFRHDLEQNDKAELLIFITPRLIQDSMAAR